MATLDSEILRKWHDFPMGPALQGFLFGEEFEFKRNLKNIRAEEIDAFKKFLSERLKTDSLPSSEEVLTMLEELVLMKIPEPALALAQRLGGSGEGSDFRLHFALGNAALLSKDFVLAEEEFKKAQGIAPDEPAPYVNLAQIFYQQSRDAECEQWIDACVECDPNYHGAWELLGALKMQHLSSPVKVGEALLKRANLCDSWAGTSLACYYLAPDDPLLRAQSLEQFYAQGLRDPMFLVELTAAEGMAGNFDKIPPRIWQAERMLPPGEKLSWQLYAHLVQAFLSQSELDSAKTALEKARSAKDLSTHAIQYLDQLEHDLLEATKDANLQ